MFKTLYTHNGKLFFFFCYNYVGCLAQVIYTEFDPKQNVVFKRVIFGNVRYEFLKYCNLGQNQHV